MTDAKAVQSSHTTLDPCRQRAPLRSIPARETLAVKPIISWEAGKRLKFSLCVETNLACGESLCIGTYQVVGKFYG